MRRTASEWLLLPVFLLPLVAAAGLAVWAREDYFGRVETYRKDGAVLARRWLERDAGRVGWLAESFSASLPQPRAGIAGWVPFRHPRASGFVRADGVPAQERTWEIGAEMPCGLTAVGLTDASARMAIEMGTPPARLPSADAGTVAFRQIAVSPP